VIDMRRTDTTADVSSLSPNQAKALNALLQTTSIGAAAEECGLSVATVKRYLADATFDAVYREQRRLILQETVAGISRLGTEAIQAFEDALNVGDLNERLRAATRVVDMIYKGTELERRIREQEELEQRITDLEIAAEMASKGNAYGRRR
jgi:hypothetical protein